MSLTDTINNTNTQKENIKTVANNIDTKLIELGGERATDLNDVVNKMGDMVGQYFKGALLKPNKKLTVRRYEDQIFRIDTNLTFTPTKMLITLKVNTDSTIINLYNKSNFDVNSSVRYEKSSVQFWVKTVNKNYVEIATDAGNGDFDIIATEILALE